MLLMFFASDATDGYHQYGCDVTAEDDNSDDDGDDDDDDDDDDNGLIIQVGDSFPPAPKISSLCVSLGAAAWEYSLLTTN